MAVDIRPLHRALKALTFTTPLPEEDASYVERPDGLGQQILNRIMAPAASRLLVGGPVGCGKSTELLQIHKLAHPNYVVVLCQCDRDLPLHRLDLMTLVRYLIWRILFVVEDELTEHVKLSPQIRRDALACIGSAGAVLPNPHMFFSGLAGKAPEVSAARLFEAFARLVAEIERTFLPVLLLIDGLEKVPPQLREETLAELVRHPMLDGCASVFVVPLWTLYGPDSMELYPNVEVLRIQTNNQVGFIHAILERRAGKVFDAPLLDEIAGWSGGLPRDGLQIAWRACRAAMDDRSAPAHEHVERAVNAIRQSWEAMLSDQPERARDFLAAVHRSGQLPGDPELRDLMLGHGIVLPFSELMFRVHPVMELYLERAKKIREPLHVQGRR